MAFSSMPRPRPRRSTIASGYPIDVDLDGKTLVRGRVSRASTFRRDARS